jgi:hypothetical protein
LKRKKLAANATGLFHRVFVVGFTKRAGGFLAYKATASATINLKRLMNKRLRLPAFFCALFLSSVFLFATGFSQREHATKQLVGEMDRMIFAWRAGTDRAPNEELIKQCVKQGANANAPCATGTSALLTALQLSNRLFQVMKASGAKADARNDLLISASQGDTKRVKKLLRSGVNPNSKDGSGNTALHYAFSLSFFGNARNQIADPAMIRALLDAGVNINAQNVVGNVPLMCAIDAVRNEGPNADTKSLELLLSRRADVFIKDKGGYSPMGLMKRSFNKNDRVFKLFQQAASSQQRRAKKTR